MEAKFSMEWVQEDGFVYGDCGTTPSEKILALDMDDTLIRTKSKKTFAIDENDWLFIHDKVATTIQYYSSKGYKIVIITNQHGVAKGSTKLEHIQRKIEAIIMAVGVPMQALIATHRNYYRKPCPGLWKFMAENLNDDIEIDKKLSIFCGDAAGRLKTETRHADFENTDYKFAINVGVTFKTPEMLYDGIHEELPEIEFHPKQLKRLVEPNKVEIAKNNQKEMIIFIGPPPSGKTTFYKNHLASDYVHISNHEFQTKAKSMKAAEAAMKEGKSVVIDCTNPQKEKRKEYLDLAKKYGYKTRAFLFNVDLHLSKHLNELRVYNQHREHHSESVAKVTVMTYFKNYEEPTLDEGFDSVEKIDFLAGPFVNKDDEDIFFSYICTKK